MTTTDPYGGAPPSPGPLRPSPAGIRRLRRSRTQRVGAGVAGGLGEYFGLDPVLFRVLFATAAFFGGAGILAYLLAWAAIPEAGTERAAVDSWIRELRRRKVPFWVVAGLAGLFLWVIAFSWWAPGPFFPVLLVVVLLAVAVTRSGRARQDPPVPAVSLTKDAPDVSAEEGSPAWLRDTREWIDDVRQARRRRVQRAVPIKIATLVALGGTLLTLALVDAAHGVVIPLYFWATLVIVVVGLLVGMALRRTPWSIVSLLVPAVAGLVAFGGTHARFHDSVGDRQWKPIAAPADHYRLAFGNAVLDLRSLPGQTQPRDIDIDVAAGQVKLLLLHTQRVVVDANVHLGVIKVDGANLDGAGGINVNRTVYPQSTATGSPITIHVRLADGAIDVERS